MPVPDFKTYCAILDRARSGHFALPAAMAERVKQATSDLRASGKTTFVS
jgi:hypothetical protein